MARLVFALALALLSAPAWSQSAPFVGKPNLSASNSQVSKVAPQGRSFALPTAPGPGGLPFAASEVAPNTTFGVGMLGLRQERFGMSPATVSEVNSPRTRRPAVGFSFKF